MPVIFVEFNSKYLYFVYLMSLVANYEVLCLMWLAFVCVFFFCQYQYILHPSWSRMQFFGGSEISPSPPAPTASGNNGHMMYVFNRNGVCLLYREWNRPLRTLNAQQDHKLMFGLLFSLKSLTAKMDPTRYV